MLWPLPVQKVFFFFFYTYDLAIVIVHLIFIMLKNGTSHRTWHIVRTTVCCSYNQQLAPPLFFLIKVFKKKSVMFCAFVLISQTLACLLYLGTVSIVFAYLRGGKVVQLGFGIRSVD